MACVHCDGSGLVVSGGMVWPCACKDREQVLRPPSEQKPSQYVLCNFTGGDFAGMRRFVRRDSIAIVAFVTNGCSRLFISGSEGNYVVDGTADDVVKKLESGADTI